MVGEGAVVTESVCTRATIGAGARIGPYSVLEPGAEVPAGADGRAPLGARGGPDA